MDRETVHQILLKVGGDITLAASFLEVKKDDLIDYLTTDPVMAPTWAKRAKGKIFSPTDLPDVPETTLRKTSQLSLDEQIALQDDYMMAQGLAGCGLTESQIAKANSFAAFAGRSFEKMVDMGHGMLAVNALKLHERAEYILENILNSDEEVTRTKMTPKGEMVNVTEPRYSEEDKIKWQKELTNLVGEMRKISDSAVNAQSIGQKMGELLEKMQNEGGRQAKRLKAAPKVD